MENTNNQLTKYNPQVEALSIQELEDKAKIFIATGWFKDVNSASQGIVKIMYGQELGLTPLQAMQQVFVIPSEGGPKLQIGGLAIAARIKASGKYDYRVIESTTKRCEIEFILLPETTLGRYTYEYEQAVNAGLTGKKNWKTNPKDMMFNRCISGGYKQHCPDIFNLPVYSEAEATEFADFTVIEESTPQAQPTQTAADLVKNSMLQKQMKNGKNGTNGKAAKAPEAIQEVKQPESINPAETIASEPAAPAEEIQEAEVVDMETGEIIERDAAATPAQEAQTEKKPKRPYDPEVLKNFFAINCENRKSKLGYGITPRTLTHVNICLNVLCCNNNEGRLRIIKFLTGKDSSKDLLESEASVFFKWTGYNIEAYNKDWMPLSDSIKETQMILETAPEYVSDEEQKDIAFVEAFGGGM